MKHTSKILFVFISLFLLSQVLGMYLLSLSVTGIVQTANGAEVIYSNTSIGERPDVQGYDVLIYIGIGVLIGTVLLLLIAKFNKVKFWKVWFFLAAWMTMSISLGVIFGETFFWISWILAAILAFVKIKYPHPIIHNLTELLMYSGIGILLVPILTVPVAIILLVIISIYDAYAVWKSKHMVKLAEFTKKTNLFPGLSLMYRQDKNKTTILSGIPPNHTASKSELKSEHSNHKKSEAKIGVLGGGDVIFPLLFSGAVFTHLLASGRSQLSSLAFSSIISLGAAIALTLLFMYGKKDRYYPAMPYITTGCIVGYIVMLIVL
jgi:presenilin-like A22 family membrane protease